MKYPSHSTCTPKFNKVKMKFISFKNPEFIDWVIVPLVLLGIILLGHYGLFLGHTFLVHQDSEVVFSYGTKDTLFSGWRPDLGFGMTFFFGDPGVFHTWSLFRLWHALFSDPDWAFSSSILLLLWIASVVLYYFLRKTVPDLNRISAIALASLIPFGSLRPEFIFQRHWVLLIISSALVSLILYDFFKSPSPKHFYLYTLTLFSAVFLGSSIVGTPLLFFTVIFFLLYVYYHDLHKNHLDLWVKCKRFFLLNLGSGICILFLGAWVFYSIFLEASLTEYVRTPNFEPDTFFSPQLSPLFFLKEFFGFFHAGLFSIDSGIMGIGAPITGIGLKNVSPLFPMVLALFFFQKSQSFWEFFAKFIVIGFLLLDELWVLMPGLRWLLPSGLVTFGTLGLVHIIHIFEVILLGIFIQRLQSSTFRIKHLGIKIMRGIAMGLSFLYGCLIILVSGSKFAPEKFNFFLQEMFHWVAHRGGIGEEKEEFLSTVISENIQLLHETMGWSYVIFYGLTFLLVLGFLNKKFPEWLSRNKGIYFSLLLLITNIFLAWAIYPLNKEPLIWERQDFAKLTPPVKINAYDRTARVNAATGTCGNTEDFIACAKFKFLEGEFGPKRFVAGYRLAHGLTFTGLASFYEKGIASLITKFLEIDGLNIKGPLRYLQKTPPFSLFKIYDFAGVKYFASAYPLPTSEKIKLVHSSFQFYLYQNLDAWPYYYLADKIETISEVGELYNAKKGVAYLWEGGRMPDFSSTEAERGNLIELTSFKFGEIEFRSSSTNEEFLVVADAWHPHWHALVDGREVEVIKTNGVSKGVSVPPGNHRIRLFFDNKPYRPGIWISILSWIIFVGAWASLRLRRSHGLSQPRNKFD
mgnify:FL=1